MSIGSPAFGNEGIKVNLVARNAISVHYPWINFTRLILAEFINVAAFYSIVGYKYLGDYLVEMVVSTDVGETKIRFDLASRVRVLE